MELVTEQVRWIMESVMVERAAMGILILKEFDTVSRGNGVRVRRCQDQIPIASKSQKKFWDRIWD